MQQKWVHILRRLDICRDIRISQTIRNAPLKSVQVKVPICLWKQWDQTPLCMWWYSFIRISLSSSQHRTSGPVSIYASEWSSRYQRRAPYSRAQQPHLLAFHESLIYWYKLPPPGVCESSFITTKSLDQIKPFLLSTEDITVYIYLILSCSQLWTCFNNRWIRSCVLKSKQINQS